MQNRVWKVGELSKLTGLTIRTLHHYDEIGLLCPSSHTHAGHRLYENADIVKLQQIMSLKELGFALEEIKEMFENPSYNPKEILEMQLDRLNREIKLKEELKQQLQELCEVFDVMEKPAPEQFIKAIELIRNQSKYFTLEQRIKLKKHYSQLSATDTKAFADSWNQLITLLQAEMDRGTPTNDPKVIELAQRWQDGIHLFTGGDMGIIQSAERYYRENSHAAEGSGMSGELYKYINEALLKI